MLEAALSVSYIHDRIINGRSLKDIEEGCPSLRRNPHQSQPEEDRGRATKNYCEIILIKRSSWGSAVSLTVCIRAGPTLYPIASCTGQVKYWKYSPSPAQARPSRHPPYGQHWQSMIGSALEMDRADILRVSGCVGWPPGPISNPNFLRLAACLFRTSTHRLEKSKHQKKNGSCVMSMEVSSQNKKSCRKRRPQKCTSSRSLPQSWQSVKPTCVQIIAYLYQRMVGILRHKVYSYCSFSCLVLSQKTELL